MKSKVPFDHPYRSDKDGLIRDLRNQVDELAKENIRLENINRGIRCKKLKKFCAWAVLSVLAATVSFGVVYRVYVEFQKDIHLGRQCSKLCSEVLGHISIMGDETVYGGCGDSYRHCTCRAVSGHEISLGTVTEKELNSDLSQVAKKFDFKSWRECVNLVSKVPDISCGDVPRIDRNGKAEQDRVDGGDG